MNIYSENRFDVDHFLASSWEMTTYNERQEIGWSYYQLSTDRSELILASSSTTRSELLLRAGVEFDVEKPRLDEQEIRNSLIEANTSPRNISDALAEAKAQIISRRFPAVYVLGTDQILEFENQTCAKAKSPLDLAKQLDKMSGKTHYLHSAAVLYRNGEPIWRAVETVKMIMREMTAEEVDNYVIRHFDEVSGSVGGYRFEREGAGLFTSYEGDFYSILGLPLIPVLNQLRILGILR